MTPSVSEFVTRAEQIFCRPERQYTWVDIVRGAAVLNRHGQTRIIPAVGRNTFRAFHRLDKSGEGPRATFVNFFVSEKRSLLDKLGRITTSDALHQFSNHVCDTLIKRLGNILQHLAQTNAGIIRGAVKAGFHPIYFDLFWNDRFKNWGGNLFETNP